MRARRRSAGRPSDGGSATVWVLACVLILLTIGTAVWLRALAVLVRHRAESAADLAALAAAGRIGTSGSPCAAADAVAARNGARLASCTPALAADGRSGTVRVRIRETVEFPVVGPRAVLVEARAGRLAVP